MFFDRKEIFKFLAEQSEDGREDLVALLKADDKAPFLAETVFLQGWNRELENRPEIEGLNDLEAYAELYDEENPDSPLCVHVWLSYKDADYEDEIILVMIPSADYPGQYGLQIYRNDNLIYERAAEHDPATEWLINGMAEDSNYQNENGETAFHGATTNI